MIAIITYNSKITAKIANVIERPLVAGVVGFVKKSC
jgi:hypothetical protein